MGGHLLDVVDKLEEISSGEGGDSSNLPQVESALNALSRTTAIQPGMAWVHGGGNIGDLAPAADHDASMPFKVIGETITIKGVEKIVAVVFYSKFPLNHANYLSYIYAPAVGSAIEIPSGAKYFAINFKTSENPSGYGNLLVTQEKSALFVSEESSSGGDFDDALKLNLTWSDANTPSPSFFSEPIPVLEGATYFASGAQPFFRIKPFGLQKEFLESTTSIDPDITYRQVTIPSGQGIGYIVIQRLNTDSFETFVVNPSNVGNRTNNQISDIRGNNNSFKKYTNLMPGVNTRNVFDSYSYLQGIGTRLKATEGGPYGTFATSIDNFSLTGRRRVALVAQIRFNSVPNEFMFQFGFNTNGFWDIANFNRYNKGSDQETFLTMWSHNLCEIIGEDDCIIPNVLEFTKEARSMFIEWRNNVHRTEVMSNIDETYATAHAKMDIMGLRFALILEMMYYAFDEGNGSAISVRAVEGAIKLVAYFKHQAQMLHQLSVDNDVRLLMSEELSKVYNALPNDAFKTSEGLKIALQFKQSEWQFKRFLKKDKFFENKGFGLWKKKITEE